MSSNGESTVDTEDLTIDEKLNIILQAIVDLNEEFILLKEELSEKLANLSTSGDGFDFEDLDES